MKPEFEVINSGPRESFIAKHVVRKNRPILAKAWHYHPEIEICYTSKSHGTRYVGNNISNYSEGDLVMLGSYLPHGFTTSNHTDQIVIQFNASFLGGTFLNLHELKKVNELIGLSNMGLVFSEKTKRKALKQINKILKSKGVKKLFNLIHLLDVLAKGDKETICSKSYSLNINKQKLNRVQRIFNYIEVNYQNPIDIQDVCKEVNLTESAFYKFIKRHTNKKFTQLLNEYRIEHACKLLVSHNKLSIAEVCYKSGYNNLSYFNRKFKEIMMRTPQQFVKEHKSQNQDE